MEVLRVPPYPLVTTWDVPSANTAYVIKLEDLVDHSVESFNVTSNTQSKVVFSLPKSKVEFDREFAIRFYDTNNEIVVDSNLTVYRPYVDPATLGTTASEIAEYKMLEMVARSIIDDYTGDGFYNHKLVIQGTGLGTDYYPIWHDASKVLKVYENGNLVYDIDAEDPTTNVFEYKVLLDNSAIYRVVNEAVNALESSPITIPRSNGDLWFEAGTRYASFPKGWEYTFILDAGYKAIPAEIEYATKLLIDDLKCGRLDYYQRYISSYNTDQFRIQFDKRLFDGTGNIIVDKILNKYVKTINRLGVL